MSMIHIARNNAVLGQFSEEDVRTGLADGTYLSTDLAWRTGLAQWTPIGEWPEFAPETGTPPPINAETIASPEAPDMPSWERRKEIGFFSALITTAKEVFMTPDITFVNMRRTGGLGSPFLYYIIPQAVTGVLMSVVMSVMFGVVMAGAQAGKHSPQEEEILALFSGFGALGIGLIYLIAFIVIVPVSLFVGAGILHLLLKLWGACNAPFEITFRVLAYTWGAVGLVMFPLQILGVIPCVGFIFGLAALVVSVWGLVIAIKGLAKTHEAPVGRVVGAVLTPVIVFCCIYAVIMFSVIIPAMAARTHH